MKIKVNINELRKKLEFELSERKRKAHSCTEVVASWQRTRRDQLGISLLGLMKGTHNLKEKFL